MSLSFYLKKLLRQQSAALQSVWTLRPATRAKIITIACVALFLSLHLFHFHVLELTMLTAGLKIIISKPWKTDKQHVLVVVSRITCNISDCDTITNSNVRTRSTLTLWHGYELTHRDHTEQVEYDMNTNGRVGNTNDVDYVISFHLFY